MSQPSRAVMQEMRTLAVYYVLEDLGPLVVRGVDRALADIHNPDGCAVSVADAQELLAARGVQMPVFTDSTAEAGAPPDPPTDPPSPRAHDEPAVDEVAAAEAALAAAEAELAAVEADLGPDAALPPPDVLDRLHRVARDCQMAVLANEVRRRAASVEGSGEPPADPVDVDALAAGIAELADELASSDSSSVVSLEGEVEGAAPEVERADEEDVPTSRLLQLLGCEADGSSREIIDARVLILSRVMGLGPVGREDYRAALRLLLEVERSPPASPREGPPEGPPEKSEGGEVARPDWLQRTTDRHARANNHIGRWIHLAKTMPGVAQMPGVNSVIRVAVVNSTSNPIPTYAEPEPKRSESSEDRRLRLQDKRSAST